MKNVKRVLLLIIVLGTILWGYSLNTFATYTMSKQDIKILKEVMNNTVAYDGDKLSAIKSGDDVFPLFLISESKGDYNTVSFNSKFNTLQTDMQNVVLANFQNAVEKSAISSQGKQLLMSEIRQFTDFDNEITQKMITDVVQPDIFSGYEYLKPFSSVFGTIMGVVCVVIVMTLVFSTILDLMYISFPTMRERMDDSAKESKFGKHKLDRPWYISYDASHACKTALTEKEYKNPMVLYFKHRVLTYIILAVCLSYLIGGLFVDLLMWLVNAMNQAFGWSA